MANEIEAKYRYWLDSGVTDEATKQELREAAKDPKELEDRFYKDLEFGTGGLRGILGAGSNRMNIYTVRKATQGLANYILDNGEDAAARGAVISYDCRHFSQEFAMEAARVFAANGIRAYVFFEMRPTPVLSFAVRYLKTFAGIMITASHNPAKYNGYKVYGSDGAQLNVEGSNVVIGYINQMDIFQDVKTISEDEGKSSGLIQIVGDDVTDAFLDEAIKCSIHPDVIREMAPNFKIVYTPFHGTGLVPVQKILARAGFTQVYTVPEQAVKDPDFSTVKSPNPEEKEGFRLAIELAKKVDADVIIGTDPDADRIGVLSKDGKGGYDVLTGNQTGELLTQYILSEKQKAGVLSPDDYVVKTIVTTDLIKKMAAHYGVGFYEVFTGFKFIAEIIKKREGKPGQYLFGFEESYGCLPGTYARDKDAVAASLLACELAAVCKKNGQTLKEALEDIYKVYGAYTERTVSVMMEGLDGMEKMAALMDEVEKSPLREIGGVQVLAMRNYRNRTRYDFVTGDTSELELEASDVLYFELEGGGFFVMRPSGTEPKIKFYYSMVGKDMEDGERLVEQLDRAVRSKLLK